MKDYMASVSVEEAINAGHTDTLCWDCKNAMRGGVQLVQPGHSEACEGLGGNPYGCRVCRAYLPGVCP